MKRFLWHIPLYLLTAVVSLIGIPIAVVCVLLEMNKNGYLKQKEVKL